MKRSVEILTGCVLLVLASGCSELTGMDAVPEDIVTSGAVDQTQTPIVGGQDATPGSRPYQVSVQRFGGHWCGGALLTDTWVLTAKHCLGGTLKVRVGVHRLSSSEGQIISLVQTESHPQMDIALLRLSSPASPDYTPLELPTQEVMSGPAAPGETVEVSGWGDTSEGGRGSDVLQEVAVPVVSNSTCNAPQAYNGRIEDSEICAGFAEGGKDSCQGDSGGPLVVDFQGKTYSVGVVSWGEGCARPNKYGVYARTISAKGWIEGHIGSGPPPPDPNSCVANNACGGRAPGGCYCDSVCERYGDCCSDGPC
ncbi:MAG: trypsin-like serine protease [Proteobacteria bacterium]|nr:trypsin-like serine protease [Pseudomonadota bacterium]